MRRPHPRNVVTTALVAVVSVVALTGAPAQGVGSGWQARMLEKINAVRASAGVEPVRPCTALDASAVRYAGVMAAAGRVGHDVDSGRTLTERMTAAGYRAVVAGENVAGGQETVVRVMRAWRASPGHLATMTDPRFTHVGLAHAATPGVAYEDYWVQEYGTGGRC